MAGILARLRLFAASYSRVIHKIEHVSHLTYFALVALHGPYYWPAGVCFIMGAGAMCLRLDNGGESHET